MVKGGVLGKGGMHGKGGHVWQRGGGHAWYARPVIVRAVCILLECILVTIINVIRDLHRGPQYGTITRWIEERFIAATFSDEVTESEKPNSPDHFEMSVWGCAWLRGVRGCSGGACMAAPGGVGACMVAPGGWGGMRGCSRGACVVAPGGACMVAPRGHVWLLPGGCVW